MVSYQGYSVIGSLVRASLLMQEETMYELWEGKSVRMHDVVREMALWIANDLGEQKEAFIACARVGLKKMPKVKNWEVVERISLSERQNYHLLGRPSCPQLKTFLTRKAGVQSISSEFFESMPKLVVLDLSYNRDLSELPDGISKLVSLQYLNLSTTRIRDLRMDLLQELKNLIHLDLTDTVILSSIAGISRLVKLKILKLMGSKFSWDCDIVEELEALKDLEIITSELDLSEGFEQFLRSHKLMSCTRSIEFRDSSSIKNKKPHEISLPVAMDKLRGFRIRQCRVSEIKMENIYLETMKASSLHNLRSPRFLNLSSVTILGCRGLTELTLLMFAPNLKNLYVSSSHELEDIINKEKACGGNESEIFQNLVYLRLDQLPALKNIYWNPLPLPYLSEIYVSKCPNLKRLPLNSQSGKHGDNELIIRYEEQEWIEGVEWEDEATKTRFLSSCKKGFY